MGSGSISFGAPEASPIPSPAAVPAASRKMLGTSELRSPRRLSRYARRALQVFGIGILVAVGSVAAMLAVFWIRSQGAVLVVQTQMEEIRLGKVEEAYALFSSGYQAGVTLPMFRSSLRHHAGLSKAHKLQLWGRSVWGKTALLWGSIQDDLGHSYPVRYLLVREKGSWRIQSFHVSAEIPDSSPEKVRLIQI